MIRQIIRATKSPEALDDKDYYGNKRIELYVANPPQRQLRSLKKPVILQLCSSRHIFLSTTHRNNPHQL